MYVCFKEGKLKKNGVYLKNGLGGVWWEIEMAFLDPARDIVTVKHNIFLPICLSKDKGNNGMMKSGSKKRKGEKNSNKIKKVWGWISDKGRILR